MMTKPLDPRSSERSWQRLRRFFHFKGSLGGLRYEARLGIFELRDPTSMFTHTAALAAAENRILPAAVENDRSVTVELQAWESEGGASLPQEG
jgi:hypothetical protein